MLCHSAPLFAVGLGKGGGEGGLGLGLGLFAVVFLWLALFGFYKDSSQDKKRKEKRTVASTGCIFEESKVSFCPEKKMEILATKKKRKKKGSQ